MLKTLSSKLAKLKKGVVGISDGKKKYSERVEPVGSNEIDNSKVGNNEVRKN